MDLLPDDLLIGIFGRLPPCSLAATRCVRKNWCAIIDNRRLLRTDLLPLRLDGFFFLEEVPGLLPQRYFFSRSSTGCKISGNLDFLYDDEYSYDDCPWILDHCNGLLLLWELVVNPATRQWVSLPPFPEPCVGMEGFYTFFFLAYDPMVSPHYEIVVIPFVPSIEDTIKLKEESEWPPSSFATHVFSSKKWRWEERSFVREGKSAGTIADMHSEYWQAQLHHALYLRGALYVHCQNNAVMRITLWNNKYQMIKSPIEDHVFYQDLVYLGKSQKGVYCASLSEGSGWPRYRVWLLNELGSEMEWILKSDISLQTIVENFLIDYTDRYDKPWILNYEKDVSKTWIEDEAEWDFESGIVLHETNDNITTCHKKVFFLGFHPYKEIGFFLISFSRVVSYHLNSSKVQELGILRKPIVKSFPYTPSWMELFENNYSSSN